MEVLYKNKKLREICERESIAYQKLGADSAHKLKVRLSALWAATCVTDLIAGNPHPLKGDKAGQFSLDLARGCRLVFAPAHESQPTCADGGIDWSRVSIVSIEFIGDYHE